jgi:NAD(P)-dependent dehydrogenase (short-subunit alcohol dehydrogenase family)
MKLENKVAIVTGASSGMGKAIAGLFAQEGATVIALARRKERLEELAASLADAPGKIVPFAGDVSAQETVDAIVDFAVKEYGGLDIVVNNAGVMDEMKPAAEVTDELWDKVFAVNVTAVMRLTRRALAEMLPKKKGVFVTTASVGGLFGSRAGAAYTASKHAVVGFTKNLGFQYALEGIRANAICPGGVNTEIMAAGMANVSPFGAARAGSGSVTNPRMGEPEEIAKVALFLASEDSSFVNGATLVADSGWTAY